MTWPTDLICSILPHGIEFPASMADDLAGVECRLAFRSSAVDGRSNNGFRWPAQGWTGRVGADPSDADCSYGLHAAGSGGLRSCMGFGTGRRGELIAVPVDEIVYDDTKVRFGRAYVLGLFDLPALIRAGLFAGADLTGANLTGADLNVADLRWADLTGATLTDANLRWADLTGATLTDADLRWADLTGATLTDADLRWADLTDANLTDATLTDADLRWADLTGATLTGASLTDATLYRAAWDESTVWPAGFTPPEVPR